MIKDTCFHPCNVASGDSTMIQWDRVSQESLEKKGEKWSFVFLEWNSILFFLWAYPGFLHQSYIL